jgi:hypothetical protein
MLGRYRVATERQQWKQIRAVVVSVRGLVIAGLVISDCDYGARRYRAGWMPILTPIGDPAARDLTAR